MRKGPPLLEAHCHFYISIRFLKKGVKRRNLFPEVYFLGGPSNSDKQLPTQERCRTTTDCRDLGIPAGKSLCDHYPPPSALCTQSAKRKVEEKKKKRESLITAISEKLSLILAEEFNSNEHLSYLVNNMQI